MKILITGSEGFVGKYLVEELSKSYQVLGVDDLSRYPRLKLPKRRPLEDANYLLYQADIRNFENFLYLIRDNPCEYMILLAARMGGVKFLSNKSYNIILDGEKLAVSEFEAARYLFDKGILKKMVILSSSEVYDSTYSWPTSETDLEYFPRCPYGMQKLFLEYWAKSLYEQYGVPYVIVRPFNCFGIGEWDLEFGHVIPDIIIKAILKPTGPLEMYGTGEEVRCFTHGIDLAKGIRLAMELGKSGEAYNIGNPKNLINMKDLAEKIWSRVNPNTDFHILYTEKFKYDVQMRIPSIKKAEEDLGFKPEIDLDDKLDEVISWVRDKLKEEDETRRKDIVS